jgi:hypothetical protein
MRSSVKPFAALLDPMVVVTMMTTFGLIIGILALAYAASVAVGWKIVTLCFAIGLVGILTMLLQMRAILRARCAQKKLAELYAEGRGLTLAVVMNLSDSLDPFSDWRARVKTFLEDYLDSSYVVRFDTANLEGVNVLLEFLKERK